MYSKLTVSFLLSSLLSISNAAVHEIDVGEDGLRFSPERVDNVSQGDVLIFKLYPEHTVIQSNFGSPCTPAEGGFYSGPFSGTDNGKKVFVVNVTGEGPWYWYCGVDRHCQNGMVGGRNLPSQGETLDAYKNKAKNVQNSESPSQLSGGVLVEEGQISSLTASAASTATVTATSTASQSTSQTTSASDSTATTTVTESATSTATGTGTATTSSATGAADPLAPGHGSTGALGVVLGLFAWLL